MAYGQPNSTEYIRDANDFFAIFEAIIPRKKQTGG